MAEEVIDGKTYVLTPNAANGWWVAEEGGGHNLLMVWKGPSRKWQVKTVGLNPRIVVSTYENVTTRRAAIIMGLAALNRLAGREEAKKAREDALVRRSRHRTGKISGV